MEVYDGFSLSTMTFRYNVFCEILQEIRQVFCFVCLFLNISGISKHVGRKLEFWNIKL